MASFLLFVFVGFLAQLVDGALGMAYGIVSSTVLLSFGVAPATASASVHAAEVFTTAASAGSHAAHRNVDWKLFIPLAVTGAVGGALGAFVLTSIDGKVMKPVITGYLALMGAAIVWRVWRSRAPRPFPRRFAGPLGLVGGFLDAAGGGGWGPTVNSALVSSGEDPRLAVGTTNTAEFFVTATISAAFLAAVLTGHWRDAQGFQENLKAIGGLIVGGVAAAPIAGYAVKIVPRRQLTYTVGVLVLILAAYQTATLTHLIQQPRAKLERFVDEPFITGPKAMTLRVSLCLAAVAALSLAACDKTNQEIKNSTENVANSASTAVDDAANAAKSAVDKLQDSADNAVDKAAPKIGDVAKKAGETVSDLADKTGEAVAKAGKAVEKAGDKAADRVTERTGDRDRDREKDRTQ